MIYVYRGESVPVARAAANGFRMSSSPLHRPPIEDRSRGSVFTRFSTRNFRKQKEKKIVIRCVDKFKEKNKHKRCKNKNYYIIRRRIFIIYKLIIYIYKKKNLLRIIKTLENSRAQWYTAGVVISFSRRLDGPSSCATVAQNSIGFLETGWGKKKKINRLYKRVVCTSYPTVSE